MKRRGFLAAILGMASSLVSSLAGIRLEAKALS